MQAVFFCEIVRYADDFVCVVQYAVDAERIERALKNRFNKYDLEIQPAKSRECSFGRANTFDFLGFTHYCDVSRKGNFKVSRQTSRKKYAAKCRAMNTG